MGLSRVERVIGRTEDLSSLSVEELAELCFEQQPFGPDFHASEDEVLGYIPQGAAPTFANFVYTRELQRQYHSLRNDVEFGSILGKLMHRRELARKKQAAALPEGARPVYRAYREFKSVFDPLTGKYRGSDGDEWLRISDQALATVEGEQLMPLTGSQSRLYELTLGGYEEGEDGLKYPRRRVHYEAEYPFEASPYDYLENFPKRNPGTAQLDPEELKRIIIKHGQLDRNVQLELTH